MDPDNFIVALESMVVALTTGFTSGPVGYKNSSIFFVTEDFIKGCLDKLSAQLCPVTMAI